MQWIDSLGSRSPRARPGLKLHSYFEPTIRFGATHITRQESLVEQEDYNRKCQEPAVAGELRLNNAQNRVRML